MHVPRVVAAFSIRVVLEHRRQKWFDTLIGSNFLHGCDDIGLSVAGNVQVVNQRLE